MQGFYLQLNRVLLLSPELDAATFISVVDYGDVICMHASSPWLHTLDTV